MSVAAFQPIHVTSSVAVQTPLSRCGRGPGLLLVRTTCDTHEPRNTKHTLDPEPMQKWAEESYTVAQVTVSSDCPTIKADIQKALDALASHEKCTDKTNFGVICYGPLETPGLVDSINASPSIRAVVSYGPLPGVCTKPHMFHLAEKGIKTDGPGEEAYRYAEAKSPFFILPSHQHFLPASAGVAHSRSLGFLKKQLNGPWFDIESIWEEHTSFEFDNRSVENTMSTMVQEPYVNHIPTLTGGVGKSKLTSFYANHFIFSNPDDAELQLVSRTIGIDRVVDEFIFDCTHDKPIDWLIPGIPPTGKKLRIPFTAVVNIRGDRLYHEHISWDQLTVLFQLGLMPEYLPFPYPFPNSTLQDSSEGIEYRVPGTGSETAAKLVDESAVQSNEMLKFEVRAKQK